jgi:hypothetical protein
MKHESWLEKFIQVYTQLGNTDFHILGEIYHPDVEFIDPMHHISGADSLIDYFHHLYTNIESCCFDINHVVVSGNEAALYWTMHYQHKWLNGGKIISVEGHSRLKGQEGLVIYHRDYLDVGAMVYEHIPVLGSLIRVIKNRAGDV